VAVLSSLAGRPFFTAFPELEFQGSKILAAIPVILAAGNQDFQSARGLPKAELLHAWRWGFLLWSMSTSRTELGRVLPPGEMA